MEAHLRYIFSALLMFSLVGCGHAKHKRFEITTKEVEYKVGNKTMKGYVAQPVLEKDAKQALKPAVLVVHEWWGQTDYPRKRAEMLAELGYVAMAVDMYGNRKIAEHPKDAGSFAKAAMKNPKNLAKRFNAALETIQKQPGTDPAKVAAIGYCFGGSVVMEMAKQGADLKGVVSFHGGLKTPTSVQKGVIKAPMLVLNGAADPMVTSIHIESFKGSMNAAGAKYEFKNYEGAKHGFTNPAATRNGEKFKLPLAYDLKADQDSWKRMKDFLDTRFK